ncbi:MAG: hypothetical protein C5B52_18330 [Bacteroidetes bacterium]|nr:MAG: hypothetical protein C5B52_18330 [Bacteroidota bacterium]
MANLSVSDRLDIIELANKLFMYTDAQMWEKLLKEVFTEEIWFDMVSMGAGPAQRITAEAVCEMWRQGFTNLDSVHHQAGHYLIEARGADAEIYGYAVATHYKKEAIKGHTRSFTGSYELKATKGANGWRLSKFKYNLKFSDGNLTLE